MSKENEESNGNGYLLVGLIAGVIVGAAAAMLLSPKTGKENWQTMKESIAKGRESFAKGVDRIRDGQDSLDEEKV